MRQVRRGRILHIGILFLIYSCLYVYSAKIKSSTEEEINEDQTSPQIELNMSPNPTFNTDFYTTSKEESDMVELTTHETPHITHHHAHPTWRPKRTNCTPPAIEQFPQPLMGPNARKHGGLVIHVIVAIFTFLGLAIVCDDYFVSSLDRICEELKLSPDVAGATFMAAGSSAPELATVVIGVFFAKDDIGVSGVIGSAVFNIMFVISVCALCSGTVCQLNWWPLVRDCFFYSVSILVMLIIIFNDVISWVEALIMLIFYVFYCIALHFNTALERWAQTWKLPIKLPTREEQSALVTYKNISDPTYTQNAQAVTNLSQEPQEQPKPDEQSHIYDANASWDPNAAWGDESTGGGGTYGTAATTTTGGWDDAGQQSANSWDPNSTWEQGEGQQNYGYNRDGAEQNMQETNIGAEGGANVGNVAQTQQITSYYKSAEPKNTEPINPLEKPTTGGTPALIAWGIVFPIHYMCRLTMPDCRLEKYRNWYPFTFLISMIWISFYSYFMVWMITIIGATLGIPDTVMGLTFVAAGVSVPDALSSIAVIKEGYGDMAVSNAIGSNVFDILICLGLPWFIQTAIIKPGSHVNVISKGLAYSTLSLLSTVIFLLVATHLNGWKLDKRLGIVLMVWYLIFITVASLYELNVFGQLNPPECPSNY